MTTSSAKKLGLTTARKWFIAKEVPFIGDAVRMMASDGPESSPSWQDIQDVSDMQLSDGVLHIEAAIVLPRTVERVNVNAVMMPG